MGKIKLLNTCENGYFENNQIDIADSIPTSGSYKVGDIIIKATQLAGTAIGWICVTAGNPGVWSEFGGMLTDDRELVINPDSITMTELAVDVKAKLGLVTSLNTTVKQIRNELDDYATKEDLEKIDLSDYATKEDLENIDVSGTVGQLTELTTNNKNTIVDAINELNNLISGQIVEAINTLNESIDLL